MPAKTVRTTKKKPTPRIKALAVVSAAVPEPVAAEPVAPETPAMSWYEVKYLPLENASEGATAEVRHTFVQADSEEAAKVIALANGHRTIVGVGPSEYDIPHQGQQVTLYRDELILRYQEKLLERHDINFGPSDPETLAALDSEIAEIAFALLQDDASFDEYVFEPVQAAEPDPASVRTYLEDEHVPTAPTEPARNAFEFSIKLFGFSFSFSFGRQKA